ncbi:MAG: Rid family hydrolase [Burkholderiaceae bacterium]
MRVITSGKPWEGRMRYAPAVRVAPGSLIFTSGLVGRGADGKIVVGGMGAQARQAFANIRDVLEAGGASMSDVVKLSYYVTDMARWEEVAEARAEFFAAPLPASATVEVVRLWDENCLVEIEAIAVVEQQER